VKKSLEEVAVERGQSPELLRMADDIARSEGGPGVVAASQGVALCAMCGNTASAFRDELSAREWRISRLCQVCQDDVFAEPEE
jgi:hypothetical protein